MFPDPTHPLWTTAINSPIVKWKDLAAATTEEEWFIMYNEFPAHCADDEFQMCMLFNALYFSAIRDSKE